MTTSALPGRDVRVTRNRPLRPVQQPSSLKIRRSADYYEQQMVKCPEVCAFHCLAELLHACLLEGDPLVESYVPQPYSLRVLGKPYVPDIYYRKQGREFVGELKPRGEFDEAMRLALETFFRFHNKTFIVISNEAMFKQEVLAQNWLTVVQNLASSEDLDTSEAEWNICAAVVAAEVLPVREFVDAGDREASLLEEIALYRLLHQGKLTTNLETQWLDYDSELRPCI